MNLTEFSKEVHANAVAHGWWEEERSFGEVIALCHSELSEALEEYRDSRPMEWYKCMECSSGFVCNPKDEYDCIMFGKESECAHRSKKPEGIAVELCDCILRILDWFGYCGMDVQKICDDAKSLSEAEFKSFMDFLSIQHAKLSLALLRDAMDDEPRCNYNLAVCINQISDWLSRNYGENWHEVMLRKHEYNKSRPYKHGGKKV